MKKILKNKKFSEMLYKMPLIKRISFSVVGAFILGFLFLSLLSYNPLDPAWSHVGSRHEISNVGGQFGAWLADILYVFFGVSVWLLVVAIAYELTLLWWRRSKVLWQLRMIAYGFLMVCLSGLLAGWRLEEGRGQALKAGGVVGLELYQSLSQLFGVAITVLFLMLLAGLVLVLVFELRGSMLFGRLMGWIDDDQKNKKPTTPKNQEVPSADDELFEVIDHKPQPAPTKVQEASLTEFLAVSGLKDEVLTQKSTTHHTQSHADKAVSKTQDFVSAPAQTQHPNSSQDEPLSQPEAHPTTLPKSRLQIIQAPEYQADDAPTSTGFAPSMSTEVPQELTSERVEADFMYERGDVEVKPVSHEFSNDNWVKFSENPLNLENTPIISDEQTSDDEGDAKSVAVNVNNERFDDKDEPLYDDKDSQSDDTAEVAPSPVAKPDLFDEVSTKSRAMDTLAYRMSLPPLPELSILDEPDANKQPSYTEQELMQLSELLEIKLKEFNIKAEVVSAMVGPVVTRFEVELAAGVKASRVTGASQDLARSLSMASLRVVEVIPGKPYIGIEVPNKKREMVRLIELLDTPDYKNPDKQIGIAIGKDIGGNVVIADLAKAPHMLVAGTTGSGKSVFVNSILLSMLFKYTPDELKLVLIDPKQLELANYGDIPHLLTPVITDMTEATAALTWCVNEMERRYQLMSLLKVRKISEFNKKVINAEKAGEPIFDPLWRADENVSIKTAPKLKPLPLIVIVADEFADMIMQLGKTAEEPIVRLAQKARAAGIHLVLATQRPTVNVVTGLIKANIPSRVALRVNSKVDSRTIIEEGGAENMLGNGDMMFIGPGENSPRRVHGAYVDDDEVNRVCDAWRERGSPDYIDLSSSYTFEGEGSGDGVGVGKGGDDEYYHQAVTFVMESRKVSISSIQRKLGIGYNRAARIVDMMEEAGLVSPMDNAGKRQILM